MIDPHDELLNLYDAQAQVVGVAPRAAAKASGQAVGAVNALVADAQGRVLLQHRPPDKENGGLWDKSVGGHVSAREEFDETLVREAGEELFSDPRSPQVRLASGPAEYERLLATLDLHRQVLLRRVLLQKNLRDVRHVPGGGFRNVLYHVAVYLGRTAVPLQDFRPQGTEIVALQYFAPAEVDRLLLRGEVAPNLAFLWLTQAQALLA